ncbi:MAG: hypothetical protein ACR2LQ_08715 [Acidimicrobiales bacterium]
MAPEASRVRGVLAMGDFGHERCGVGGSEAIMSERLGDLDVLDTAAKGLAPFVRDARRASLTGAVCVGVYPTTMTVYRVGLLPRAVVLRALFGRERFRLHLHEYQHLRRMLRWPVTLVALLAGRIIVSSASERDALRAAARGLIGRRCTVEVAAPTNGMSPSRHDLDVALEPNPERERTVGVFGLCRPDKGADWLAHTLERLGPQFNRLVVAGGGWDQHDWPQEVRDRYEIELLGHVPRASLPRIFSEWRLAIAPLWGPAHDGRMSLRTPLAFGVPTLSVGPRGDDLTLDSDHLFLSPPTEPSALELNGVDRRAGAEQVAAFEQRLAGALADALFG